MSLDPFYSFLALVDQDTQIVKSRKNIEQLSQKKQSLHDTLKKIQDTFAAAQAKAHNAKKNLDAQELEIKVLKERQKSLKSKLDSASSPKEYFSLETELKTIATDIDAQENKLFELFESFETLEKNMGEMDFQVVTTRAQTMQEVADIEQQITQLQQQIKLYTHTYEQLEPGVQPEMLEKFLTMKQSLQNPVVTVEKNGCSACGHTVSVQELVSMRKHKLVACQNCYRLLYSVAP